MTAAEGVRTGVCLVRAECDGSTGLRITVTCRQNLEHPETETIWSSVSIDAAVAHVLDFLEVFDGNRP